MAESTKPLPASLPVEAVNEVVANTVKSVVEELRRPDPTVLAKKEAARLRIRAERERSEANRIAIEASCAHRRDNNTSTIAWMTTPGPDGVTPYDRGVCQRCQRLIQPTDPDYRALRAVPTGVPQF